MESARIPSSLRCDVVAPKTTARISPVPYSDGWSSGTATVTLRASDNTGGSTVEEITYRATGAQVIAASSAAGNFVTINIDQPGATTVSFAAIDRAGNAEAEQSIVVKVDAVLPTTVAPVVSIVPNGRLGTTTLPVTITWSGYDNESGLNRYQLQSKVDGGSWQSIGFSNLLTTTLNRTLLIGSTYQFQVRAIDNAGNSGDWMAGPNLTVEAHQESSTSIAFSGIWNVQTVSGSSGGDLSYTSDPSARATLTFTGTQVAWVTRSDKNRGQAQVWIDGAKKATKDTYSSVLKTRRVIFTSAQMDASRTHTIELRGFGVKNPSSTGTRVDVDAIVVLRTSSATTSDTNTPPTLTPVGNLNIPEAQSRSIAISALDSVGDTITLSASNLPPFATFTDNGAGQGTLTIAPSYAGAGVYSKVRITASDGELTDTHSFTITVTDVNQSPVADAGEDVVVADANGDAIEIVSLDGSGSSDPDAPLGSIVAWEWSRGATAVATGATPSVELAQGAHTLTLKVTDNQGAVATDTVVVTVADAAAPTITASMSPRPNADGWNTGPVTVTLRATDNVGGSGILDIGYSATGAHQLTQTSVPAKSATVTISTAGVTQLTFVARDKSGNVSAPQQVVIRIDQTLAVTKAPLAAISADVKPTNTVAKFNVEWSGRDDESGLRRYQVQQRVDGGSWSSVSLGSPLATSVTRSLNVGSTYQFRTRAIDIAGNTGQWSVGKSFTVVLDQETAPTFSFGSGWASQSVAGSSGGSILWSATSGDSAIYQFSGERIAWISRMDKNRGMAEVLIDGVVVKTVDLYSPTVRTMEYAFVSGRLDASVPHTLEIRVLGTKHSSSTGTRVDIDAVLVMAR